MDRIEFLSGRRNGKSAAARLMIYHQAAVYAAQGQNVLVLCANIQDARMQFKELASYVPECKAEESRLVLRMPAAGAIQFTHLGVHPDHGRGNRGMILFGHGAAPHATATERESAAYRKWLDLAQHINPRYAVPEQ